MIIQSRKTKLNSENTAYGEMHSVTGKRKRANQEQPNQKKR